MKYQNIVLQAIDEVLALKSTQHYNAQGYKKITE
jgi:hypothetical protein